MHVSTYVHRMKYIVHEKESRDLCDVLFSGPSFFITLGKKEMEAHMGFINLPVL